VNQFSGRNAYLARLDQRLAEKADGDASGRTHAEEQADLILSETKSSDPQDRKQARQLLWDRLLPAKSFEVELGGQVTVTAEDRAAAQDRLQRLLSRGAA
jgi:hypothetical protein